MKKEIKKSIPVYIDNPINEQPDATPVYLEQAPGIPYFTTPYNYTQEQGEVNNDPSETIPNETYTIRELLEKHTRGVLPHGIHREGIYDENASLDSLDLPQTRQLDLVEQSQLIEQTKKTVDQLNALLKSEAENQKQKDEQQKASDKKDENEVKVKKEEAPSSEE